MPIKISKILVPIDFSDHSRDALVAALSLKKEFDAEIIALHAFDISELLGLGWTIYGESLEAEVAVRMELDANKALKEFLGRNGVKEGEATSVVSRGKPFVETVRLAKKEAADLIVMGTHGRKGLEHLLMGSNAEKVVRKAPCSVLTVRHREGHRETPFPVKKILMPTDFSLTSERAMSMALQLAGRYGSSITVAHVFADLKIDEAVQWTSYLSTGQTELELEEGIIKRAEEELANFIAKFPIGDVEIKTRVSSDVPHRGIVDIAKEEDVDMVVMGTHGRSGVNHLLMGSTAEKVVRLSPAPTLTVKPKDHTFAMP